MTRAFLLCVSLCLLTPSAAAQDTQKFALNSLRDFKLLGVKAQIVDHKGRRAVRLTEDTAGADIAVVLIDRTDFGDGIIELDVIGKPASGAAAEARGFVGVIFRSQPDASRHEVIYLRPTNGRAEDQLRRNHSTQYASHPEYPWYRLRKEHPGVYESYVDLVPGEWTRMRVEVKGIKARLFINGAKQPCLIVNDLKLAESHGAVGLWVGPGTEGYFSNLKITPEPHRFHSEISLHGLRQEF